jgi:DNA-binding transcriptional regulator YdaS (Cro superfamily)
MAKTLDQYLNDKALTEPAFGALIGVSQQHVNRLRRRLKGPSLPLAVRIEKATKGEVPVAVWSEAPQKANTSAVFPGKQRAPAFRNHVKRVRA